MKANDQHNNNLFKELTYSAAHDMPGAIKKQKNSIFTDIISILSNDLKQPTINKLILEFLER